MTGHLYYSTIQCTTQNFLFDAAISDASKLPRQREFSADLRNWKTNTKKEKTFRAAKYVSHLRFQFFGRYWAVRILTCESCWEAGSTDGWLAPRPSVCLRYVNHSVFFGSRHAGSNFVNLKLSVLSPSILDFRKTGVQKPMNLREMFVRINDNININYDETELVQHIIVELSHLSRWLRGRSQHRGPMTEHDASRGFTAVSILLQLEVV